MVAQWLWPACVVQCWGDLHWWIWKCGGRFLQLRYWFSYCWACAAVNISAWL